MALASSLGSGGGPLSRPLRVGFNARHLRAPGLRGWNRYTVNLLAELPAEGVEPVLYSDAPLDPGHLDRLRAAGVATVRVGAVRPYAAWEQGWLPWRAARDRVDLLHAPANFGLPRLGTRPGVLTLHDAIDEALPDPSSPGGLLALRGRLSRKSSRDAAGLILTVSGHARGDIVTRLGVDSCKVRVTPEAADPLFHRPLTSGGVEAIGRRHGLGRPYVFYVGGWERRKNLPTLVRAFAEAGLEGVDLALAGDDGGRLSEFTGLAESLGIGGHFRALGAVADADLPGLYAGALAFVYPSRYEGFGLQLCEAMAVGCPVLAADAASLPEVLGDGGVLFDPDDPGSLAAMLRRVAADPPFRDGLAAKARSRSSAFSWRRTAAATAGFYRELLDGHIGGRGCASAGRS